MMKNQNKKDVRRAATIKDTADVVGVSTRQVQRVLAGDQENEKVVAVYMEISERKNELLEQVKMLVPFI
jgi:DNA-binding LacI/PurR family transcriptional regulator